MHAARKEVTAIRPTASSATDDDVMAASQHNPSRFGELFERHYADIFTYACRAVSHDVAEDIASETFVTALRKRATYKPGRGTARPWLFGICARLISDHRRSTARKHTAQHRLQVVEPRHSSSPADEADTRIDASAAVQRLQPAIDALSTGDRQVLELYVWSELPYAEIAEALAIPVGTVRSRLNRVRSTLATASTTNGGHHG